MYELGWIDGPALSTEVPCYRRREQHRTMATELAGLSPDVIVTGSAPVMAAAYRQTKSIRLSS